jgi:hypothetical protein
MLVEHGDIEEHLGSRGAGDRTKIRRRGGGLLRGFYRGRGAGQRERAEGSQSG